MKQHRERESELHAQLFCVQHDPLASRILRHMSSAGSGDGIGNILEKLRWFCSGGNAAQPGHVEGNGRASAGEGEDGEWGGVKADAKAKDERAELETEAGLETGEERQEWEGREVVFSEEKTGALRFGKNTIEPRAPLPLPASRWALLSCPEDAGVAGDGSAGTQTDGQTAIEICHDGSAGEAAPAPGASVTQGDVGGLMGSEGAPVAVAAARATGAAETVAGACGVGPGNSVGLHRESAGAEALPTVTPMGRSGRDEVRGNVGEQRGGMRDRTIEPLLSVASQHERSTDSNTCVAVIDTPAPRQEIEPLSPSMPWYPACGAANEQLCPSAAVRQQADESNQDQASPGHSGTARCKEKDVRDADCVTCEAAEADEADEAEGPAAHAAEAWSGIQGGEMPVAAAPTATGQGAVGSVNSEGDDNACLSAACLGRGAAARGEGGVDEEVGGGKEGRRFDPGDSVQVSDVAAAREGVEGEGRGYEGSEDEVATPPRVTRKLLGRATGNAQRNSDLRSTPAGGVRRKVHKRLSGDLSHVVDHAPAGRGGADDEEGRGCRAAAEHVARRRAPSVEEQVRQSVLKGASPKPLPAATTEIGATEEEEGFVSVAAEEGDWLAEPVVARVDEASREVLRQVARVSVASLEAEAQQRTRGPYRVVGTGARSARSVTVHLFNGTAVQLQAARYGGKACVWPIEPPPSLAPGAEVVLASAAAPGGFLGGGGSPDAAVAYSASADSWSLVAGGRGDVGGRRGAGSGEMSAAIEFYVSWCCLMGGRVRYRAHASPGWRVEREYLTGNYGPHTATRFVLTRSLPPPRFLPWTARRDPGTCASAQATGRSGGGGGWPGGGLAVAEPGDGGEGGLGVTIVTLDCGCGTHAALVNTGERARHIVAWLQGLAFPRGVVGGRGLLDLVVLQGVHTEAAQKELVRGLSRALDLGHLVTNVGRHSMGIGTDSGLLVASRFPVKHHRFFGFPSHAGSYHPALAIPKVRLHPTP